MPTPDQITRYTDIAKNVLAMCKKIQPDFWTPNHELAEAWGYVFATKPLPPAVYYEAIGVFYTEDTSGNRPDPRSIIHYAKVVRDRWEADPMKRAELNAHRDQLRDERDRQIAAGEFTGTRGLPPATPTPTRHPIPERIKHLLDNTRRPRSPEHRQKRA